MRILLDECVDQRLRFLFAGHDCQTASYAKLAGLKNGVLLAAAESAGFEVMITPAQRARIRAAKREETRQPYWATRSYSPTPRL